MALSPSTDTVNARNNTLISLLVDGQRVGRVQQFHEDQNNNVQVMAELGRDYMVELQKGITSYSFTIATFYVRSDIMDDLKAGLVFGLSVVDSGAGGEVLEQFSRCMIGSLSRDWTIGQAAVGQNAQVVVAGKGVGKPTLAG